MALSVAILPWLNCALFVFFACCPSGESNAILLARLCNLARSPLASPLYLLTIVAEPIDHLSTLQTLSSLFVPEFLVNKHTLSYPHINIFCRWVLLLCLSVCSVLLCILFKEELSKSPFNFHLYLLAFVSCLTPHKCLIQNNNNKKNPTKTAVYCLSTFDNKFCLCLIGNWE